MTSLVLLLVSRQDSVDAIFQRYVKAIQSMPTFETHLKVDMLHRTQVQADLIIDGRSRLLFDATTPGDQYILSIAPPGYREIDFRTQLYENFAYSGRNLPYKSKISGIEEAVPTWLLSKDLRDTFPKDASKNRVGEEMLSGQSCDHVHVAFKTQMGGNAAMDYWIAPSGLVYRLKSVMESRDGPLTFDWTFTRYQPLRSVAASKFVVRIPDGFMPRTLDEEDGPAAVGSKPNLCGWVEPASRRVWSKPEGRSVLFLLAGQDSLPSDRAVVAAKAWQAMLSQKGVTLAMGSDADSGSASKGLLYNPGGQSVKALAAPETPMFYLLDSAGKIRNLWMGFVPGQSAKLRDDILKAAAALN